MSDGFPDLVGVFQQLFFPIFIVISFVRFFICLTGAEGSLGTCGAELSSLWE